MFIVGCATGSVAAQLVVPPARAGTAPTRWEYHCLSIGGGAVTSTLNKLSAEGWELASVAPSHEAREVVGGSYEVDAFIACARRALP